LRGYTEGLLERPAIEETLGIGKSRFFALLKIYRKDPEAFIATYQRGTPSVGPNQKGAKSGKGRSRGKMIMPSFPFLFPPLSPTCP
jgi:hypothetical protein